MKPFDELVRVMEVLLSEGGCPWDRAQTHETLRDDLLEESYEAADAIDKKDMAALEEELGDVLMLIVFHAKLAEREGLFNINDVVNGIARKLISRHTHIFGEDKAASPEEVERFWERNKQREKRHETPADAMAAVPAAMPALMRAAKVWKRADETKRNAADARSLTAETAELLSGVEEHPEIFGEILFKLVKLSAVMQINAEYSLTNTIEAFINSERKNL